MTTILSRQHRRAIERHARGVDLATASDRRWFEEHPGRRFRVRRMTAAEIGTAEAVDRLDPLPQGTARFTLVRKITADARARLFITGPACKTGIETTEDMVAALWNHHLDRNPRARRAEASLVAAMTDRGGAA